MATGLQGNQGRPRLGPRDRLLAAFRTCSRDPTQAIESRLRCLLLTFLQHHGDHAGNETTGDLAAKCCSEAQFWYYRILENLICQERRRLGISDVSAVLEKELFQRCLVACCLEVAASSHRLPYRFPRLPGVLNLAPYDFLKVIEPVLRADVGLPRAAFRHLARVEREVLESLAWTGDSPLWEEIRANEGRLPTWRQVMLTTQPEDFHPDGNQAAGRCSPSAATRPQRSSASLQLFARKAYSLMARRLRELSSSLSVSAELRLKVWTCLEFSLVHCTDLMADRHLDQLLMCAVYIMAKVTRVEIPFRRIMKCYRSQPLVNDNVCNNVLMSNAVPHHNGAAPPTPDTTSTRYPEAPGRETGSLIHFYNQIYTTRMQRFAERFSPTAGGGSPPLSSYPRQRKASSGRRRPFGSFPVYVSPQAAAASSPRTAGLSYFFNSSPPECLRQINNMIRTGRSATRRRCGGPMRKEEGEEEEEEEGGGDPSGKRLRLDGQSAWQRRLKDVVEDRPGPGPGPRPRAGPRTRAGPGPRAGPEPGPRAGLGPNFSCHKA